MNVPFEYRNLRGLRVGQAATAAADRLAAEWSNYPDFAAAVDRVIDRLGALDGLSDEQLEELAYRILRRALERTAG